MDTTGGHKGILTIKGRQEFNRKGKSGIQPYGNVRSPTIRGCQESNHMQKSSAQEVGAQPEGDGNRKASSQIRNSAAQTGMSAMQLVRCRPVCFPISID